MVVGAIAGGASIGAGVGLSSIALMPFNAANTFLGSAFFGYGMILGERYMYQADWPKIQARLEHGEKIENIIQEYTGVFTAVVMKEAKIIFESVTSEMIDIIKTAAGLSETGTTLDVIVEKPTEPQPAPKPFIDTGETVSIKQPIYFSAPILSLGALSAANANLAQGRVVTKGTHTTYYVVESQITPGTWKAVSGTLSTRTSAMIQASRAWPSPKYYPNFRTNVILYFRIQ